MYTVVQGFLLLLQQFKILQLSEPVRFNKRYTIVRPSNDTSYNNDNIIMSVRNEERFF